MEQVYFYSEELQDKICLQTLNTKVCDVLIDYQGNIYRWIFLPREGEKLSETGKWVKSPFVRYKHTFRDIFTGRVYEKSKDGKIKMLDS